MFQKIRLILYIEASMGFTNASAWQAFPTCE